LLSRTVATPENTQSASAPRSAVPRLAALDLLRFVAALGVVSYHYLAVRSDIGWGAPATKIFPRISWMATWGSLGVDLFFIISGFVILYSAWGRSPQEFVAARTARLAPAYISVVLLTGIVLPVLRGTLSTNGAMTTIINLTMEQFAYGVANVDGPMWTLWVELCFYILIGLLLATKMSYRSVLVFIALWPLVGQLVGSAGLGKLLVGSYSPLFATGMSLFLVYKFGHNVIHWTLVVLNGILGAGLRGRLEVLDMAERSGYAIPAAGVFFMILAIVVVVALATLTPARSWSGRLGGWLGRLTYPLYLVHVAWGYELIRIFSKLPHWWTLGLVVLGVLLLACAINLLVERPTHDRLRNRLLKAFTSADLGR
jgi:peptidoglycan/LPS O-acetylase OafA/YrhL